jgi:hypothetical protein
MFGRHIAVEAGPSRTQTLLSSADERASARRCKSRRMKAARCTASWKSTRYQERLRQGRAAGLTGLGELHHEQRDHSGPHVKGEQVWRMRGNILYRWLETSTLLLGRASSSPMCMVSDPALYQLERFRP